MKSNLGKFIAKKRIDNNLTQKELAKSIGVSAAYLSAVEKGKRTLTDIQIENIVEGMNFTSEEMENLVELVKEDVIAKFQIKLNQRLLCLNKIEYKNQEVNKS